MTVTTTAPRHQRIRATTLRGCMIPGCDRTEDLHTVWHGLAVPATGCGFHTTYFTAEVAAAHHALLAQEGLP